MTINELKAKAYRNVVEALEYADGNDFMFDSSGLTPTERVEVRRIMGYIKNDLLDEADKLEEQNNEQKPN